MTQSRDSSGDSSGMNSTPTEIALNLATDTFASEVRALLENIPGPMFHDQESTVETVGNATEQYVEIISRFDAEAAAIEGNTQHHIINLLVSAAVITHRIAIETADELEDMLPEESRNASFPWMFMRENVGLIDTEYLTPGVVGAAVALQRRILWEAAYSVRSAKLALATMFITQSTDALETALSQMEMASLSAPDA